MKTKVRYYLSFLICLCMVSQGFVTLVHGYGVDSIFMSDDIDQDTGMPIGLGDTYFIHNGYIYCWINLTDVDSSHVVKFDWFNPSGELYNSQSVTTDSPDPGTSYPSLAVFSRLEIYGNEPSENPGDWEVNVYVDGSPNGEVSFSIVDYDALIQRLFNMESQVESLVAQYELLFINLENIRGDYDALSDDYDELLTEYNAARQEIDEIEEEKQSLLEDVDELVESNNNLRDEYDTLADDYESISAQLKNSKNIMYGLIAVAAILALVAVYLFMKK